jgi:hypothetical protein
VPPPSVGFVLAASQCLLSPPWRDPALWGCCWRETPAFPDGLPRMIKRFRVPCFLMGQGRAGDLLVTVRCLI